jgi:hypothetical protein
MRTECRRQFGAYEIEEPQRNLTLLTLWSDFGRSVEADDQQIGSDPTVSGF